MMIGVSKLRCGGHVKYWNSLLTGSALKPSSLGLNTHYRTFSKKSDSKESKCCKDVAQTEGREVEPWPRCEESKPGSFPKFEPAAATWRCECPREPPPPNNDPYRIKLPETVVPPLPPPCDVKEVPNEDRGLFTNPEVHSATSVGLKDLFHNSPIIHPDYWREKPPKRINMSYQDVLPRLGYHGRTKYKFAFHEPWKPLDRMSLLTEAEKEEAEQAVEAAVAQKSEQQM